MTFLILIQGEDNKMKTKLLEICPRIAGYYMEKTKSRNINKKRVQELSEIMKKGGWVFDNGTSIKILNDGTVVDGIHRLSAIIESNTQQKMLFVTGLDENIMGTIDIGKNRTGGDLLYISNREKMSTAVASLCSSIASLIINMKHDENSNPFTKSKFKYDFNEIDNLCEEDPDILHAAEKVLKYNHLSRLLPKSILGFCYWKFYKHNSTEAEMFFDEMNIGVNKKNKANTAQTLRKKFDNDKRDSVLSCDKSLTTAEQQRLKTALLFHAYRHYIKNSYVEILRLPIDERKHFKIF